MSKQKIALLGGSFNPFAHHHRLMVEELLRRFDRIIIVICGFRPDKASVNDIAPIHRAAMTDLGLRGLDLDRIRVEYFDLENDTFTRTHTLQQMFADEGEIWHVVGSDLVQNGHNAQSYIHRIWHNAAEVWNGLNFAVFTRVGYPIQTEDLPPRHIVVPFEHIEEASSGLVRERMIARQSIRDLVHPEVEQYILRHGLYLGRPWQAQCELQISDPRLIIIADQHNPEAVAAAEKMEYLVDESNPNMILVLGGDGTMLHAVKTNWRERIPFLGINFGHVGHNLNDLKTTLSPETLTQKLRLWQSPLMYVEMTALNGIRDQGFVFNDAWVSADTPKGKSAWMEVSIDGVVKLPRIVGDGLLVATAQGSTAYARAMGGTPLRNDTPEYILVGNNIYLPTGFRQARLGLNSKVMIRNLDTTGFRPLYGLEDGEPMGQIISMEARISKFAAAQLAFLPEYDPTSKLDSIQFAM